MLCRRWTQGSEGARRFVDRLAERRTRPLLGDVMGPGPEPLLERQRLPFVGHRLAFLGQLAFQVVSFLALPVIIFERTGALRGLKRSTMLLRDTWGENLVFNFALTAVGLIGIVPAIALVVLAQATGAALLFVTLAVAWFVLVVGVSSALSAVNQTALYRWANNLPVDPQFAKSDLEGAFGTR